MGDLLPPPPAPPAAPRRTGPRQTQLQRLQARGRPHGIHVDAGDDRGTFWISADRYDREAYDDPLDGDHWAGSYAEAVEKIDVYIAALAAERKAA